MSTVTYIRPGSGTAVMRLADVDAVGDEAKAILVSSGPPPGKYWFTGLITRANMNVQRRHMWDRRTAA